MIGARRYSRNAGRPAGRGWYDQRCRVELVGQLHRRAHHRVGRHAGDHHRRRGSRRSRRPAPSPPSRARPRPAGATRCSADSITAEVPLITALAMPVASARVGLGDWIIDRALRRDHAACGWRADRVLLHQRSSDAAQRCSRCADHAVVDGEDLVEAPARWTSRPGRRLAVDAVGDELRSSDTSAAQRRRRGRRSRELQASACFRLVLGRDAQLLAARR